MADNTTIARPYAQAVFELADESGKLDAWSQVLGIAGALLQDGQVIEYLGDPEFNDSQRLEFLSGLFAKAGAEMLGGKDTQGTNFLKLLLEYRRIAVLPEISGHFEALKAEVENIVEVTVTSAAPISKKQQDTISGALRERLGRDVNIVTEIDENLIGGAVIRAGDVVIDGSLRARLEGLATELAK
ncbi:MAG: F0F1 ATP synthase subunit delta [Gammaproteobacteria bacterium]|nr:F0F1 ATP synthase subunit delta [Gammaproteobacteria bacterium]MDH3372103.1 F0F1 ATP synthase subunit delta [Gammaproteobacteria bacterium]MDH3408875.1 F0F1 ATP synthase subunit delta [Gammaproteobacteria bacterium]MDH3551028.1 F0F1 ATP synthase subunit delta [Gammaproteobacteria bacterium]